VAAAQADLQALLAGTDPVPVRPLPRHEQAAQLLLARPAARRGARRGPRGADQDERPAPPPGRHVLPVQLRRGHGEDHRAPGGPQPRVADAVLLLRHRVAGHDRPLRDRPGELPAAEVRVVKGNARFVPWIFVGAGALYLLMAMLPPRDAEGEMALTRFAALPVVDRGRVK